VPEEFRIWKERMDALGKKKVAALQPPQEAQPVTQSPGTTRDFYYYFSKFIMLDLTFGTFPAPHIGRSCHYI
jgi:hypothetical protein